MPPSFSESEVPSTAGGLSRALASPCEEPCRPWPGTAGAARVHRGFEKLRLDPRRSLFACAYRAACAPTTSANGRSCEHDHGPPEHPVRLGGRRDDWHRRSKVALRSGQSPELREVRGRENSDSRRSPPGLLTVETSPQPRSLRTPLVAGKVSFPLSGEDAGESLAAVANACLQGLRARGSCDARLPRRRRALTNPRCLLSWSCPLGARLGCRLPAEADCPPCLRLFHLPGGPARGTPTRAPEARSSVQGEQRTAL